MSEDDRCYMEKKYDEYMANPKLFRNELKKLMVKKKWVYKNG